jgi:hypothetical protein
MITLAGAPPKQTLSHMGQCCGERVLRKVGTNGCRGSDRMQRVTRIHFALRALILHDPNLRNQLPGRGQFLSCFLSLSIHIKVTRAPRGIRRICEYFSLCFQGDRAERGSWGLKPRPLFFLVGVTQKPAIT